MLPSERGVDVSCGTCCGHTSITRWCPRENAVDDISQCAQLYTGSQDGTVRVWSCDSGDVRLSSAWSCSSKLPKCLHSCATILMLPVTLHPLSSAFRQLEKSQ